MENSIVTLLKLKENALASLDERISVKCSTHERELVTRDQHAQKEQRKLEEEITVLKKAARIEAETLQQRGTSKRRVNTKEEREELFARRSELMRRLLKQAHGREVHARELAQELNRPLSTVKDYYNDQPNVRPTECFWENGADGSHFRWKATPAAVIAPDISSTVSTDSSR